MTEAVEELEVVIDFSTRYHWEGEEKVVCDGGKLVPFNLVDWNPQWCAKTDEEGISITFPNNEEVSIGTSFQSSWSFKKLTSKVRSFVHDFTFGMWLKETDCPLGVFFEGLCEPREACLTPDFAGRVGKYKTIVEFTTRETNSERILKQAFEEKKNKYLAPLINISSKGNEKIFFFIIVVGSNAIFTNLSLNSTTVRELGYRYRVGRTIKKEMRLKEEFLDKSDFLTDGANDLRIWMKARTLEGMSREGEFSETSLEGLSRKYDPVKDKKRNADLIWITWYKAWNKMKEERKLFSKGMEGILNEESNKWNEYLNKMEARYGSADGGFQNSIGDFVYKRNQKTIVNVPFICLKPSDEEMPPNLTFWPNETAISQAWSEALPAWWKENDRSTDDQWEDEINDYRITETLIEETERIVESINRRIEDSKLSKEHKVSMRSRNRVKLELSMSESVDFAKVGVEGKGFKMDKNVEEYRHDTRKSFPLDIDVSDFENFMTKSHFEELLNLGGNPISGMCKSTIKTIELLNQADDLISDSKGNIYDYKEDLTLTMQSKAGLWSKMVSDIATELAISFKHHCVKGEYIIKKLKEFNLWLLIKPTRSGSHIFFSLLWPESEMLEMMTVEGKVFREWDSDGTWCWTDWVSLNNSKLTNWALCESRWISLIHYWLEFYSCEPHPVKEWNRLLVDEDESLPSERDVESYREAVRMTMLSLIIGLNDKSEVEELITSSRFMIMEGFKAFPLWPKPFKMYEKFPLHIKSRLSIWLINKLRRLSVTITTKPYKVNNTDDDLELMDSTGMANSYYWTGFVNPFTDYPLKDAGQLISLMYLGYIKNKNEGGESNSAGKLIEKIITLEDKFTGELKDRIGQKDKKLGSSEPHEWNITGLRVACGTSLEEFNKACTATSIQDKIGSDWIQRLYNTSIEDAFCTLKATSNFDETWFTYKEVLERELKAKQDRKEARNKKDVINPNDGDNINQPPDSSSNNLGWENPNHFYFRKKMIERCCEKAPEGEQSMKRLLDEAWTTVTKNNYMRICIFKKQQHGGLREIFVLNYEERIIQYAIELAGRIICELYHGETMTHPHAKKTMVAEHNRRANVTFRKGETQTTYTSADSAKWSQNQYCAKLLQVLLAFYPPEYHNFFIRALELWRHKRIKIGDDLLHIIESQPGLKFWDETTTKLSEAYHGISNVPWFRKGETFLRVSTGMMQGILHYTSSAFHSVINRRIDRCLEVVPIKCGFRGLRIIATSMQSSDDSGLMVSINGSDKFSKQWMRETLAVCHIFKSLFSEEFAIKDSIKTTHHCPLMYEFNSKFNVGNQQFEPDIKLVFASNLVSHCEDFISKQEESYTLISSLISSGGSCHLAKWVQYSQGFFHYRALGAQVSSLWAKILYPFFTHIPDPALGFFLTDHPSCAGIPGFNFLYWASVTTVGALNKSYRYQLNKLKQIKSDELKEKESSLMEEILQYMSMGGITRNHNLSFGNRQKLKRMKERIQIPEDWSEQLDNNPLLFFKNAETRDELILKVALKLSQKGVAQSLSGTPAISQLMASSIYVIQEKVLFLVTNDHIEEALKTDDLDVIPRRPDQTGKRERFSKYSLLELILSHSKLIRKSENAQKLTIEEASVLFPLHAEYSHMMHTLSNMDRLAYSKKTWNMKRISTEVEVYEGDSFSSVNLYSVLAEIWFPNERTRTKSIFGEYQLTIIFKKLQEMLDWLSTSPQESFKKSPFLSFSAMYNWFKTLHNRTRKIAIMGAPIISRRGHTTFLSYIRNNAGRYHKLNWYTHSQDRMDSEQPSIITSLVSEGKFDAVTALINSLIYPSKGRAAVACKVLRKISLVTKFNHNKTRSRMNNLVILSSILNNSPNMQVGEDSIRNLTATPDSISHLTVNKEGVTGYWKESQRWNSTLGKYEGRGVWEGIINGIKTIIKVIPSTISADKSDVSSIKVDRELMNDDLRYWSRGFNIWMKESSISSNTRHWSQSDDESLRLIDGKIKMSRVGVPIRAQLRKDEVRLDWESENTLSIFFPTLDEIEKRGIITIRLLAKGKFNQVKTILSVSLYSKDWTRAAIPVLITDYDGVDNILHSFLHNKTLEPNLGEALENQVNTHQNSFFLNLIRTNLRGNLARLGVGHRNLLPISSVVTSRVCNEINEDDFLDDPDGDFFTEQLEGMMSNKAWFKEFEEEPDLTPDDDKKMFLASDNSEPDWQDDTGWDECDLDFQIAQVTSEENQIASKTSSVIQEVAMNHPLFEKTMKETIDLFGLKTVNNIVNSGFYPTHMMNRIKFLEIAFDRLFTLEQKAQPIDYAPSSDWI